MKIRRFFAKDMRTALAEVSKELGPEAAIMSSRRVTGGVELLAAIDYDPAVLSEVRHSESRQSDPRQSDLHQPESHFVNVQSRAEATHRTHAGPAPTLNDEAAQALIALLNPSTAVPTPARTRGADKAVNRTSEQTPEIKSPLLKNLFGGSKPKAESPELKTVTKPGRAKAPAGNNPAAFGAEVRAPARALAPESRGGTGQGTHSPAPAAGPTFQLEFGNDPGLAALRDEMRQMRGLMVEQLQGLAWKDLQQRSPLRALVARRLSMFELSPRLREHYAQSASTLGANDSSEQVLAQAIAHMARDIVNSSDDLFAGGGMYALVGPTGVGKTTTIAKIAARFALQHGAQNVALVSTDSYRIAAHDQLKVYARLIGCALRVVDEPGQLAATLDGLVDKRLVLIDSAGMSQNDERLQQALSALHSHTFPLKRLLVLSATAQRGLLSECVRQFGQAPLSGVILTKLDEATSLGALLSVLIESRLPLYFGCDGQRVPEDLRPMRGVQVVERARRLAEQYQDGVDDWLLAQQWKGTADARA